MTLGIDTGGTSEANGEVAAIDGVSAAVSIVRR